MSPPLIVLVVVIINPPPVVFICFPGLISALIVVGITYELLTLLLPLSLLTLLPPPLLSPCLCHYLTSPLFMSLSLLSSRINQCPHLRGYNLRAIESFQCISQPRPRAYLRYPTHSCLSQHTYKTSQCISPPRSGTHLKSISIIIIAPNLTSPYLQHYAIPIRLPHHNKCIQIAHISY